MTKQEKMMESTGFGKKKGEACLDPLTPVGCIHHRHKKEVIEIEGQTTLYVREENLNHRP